MKDVTRKRNRYFILNGFEGGYPSYYKFNYKEQSIKFFRKHLNRWERSITNIELKDLEDGLLEIPEEEFVLLDL